MSWEHMTMSLFNTRGLTRRQQTIFDAVQKRPISTDQLVHVVYEDRPPAHAHKLIHVFVYQLNQKLMRQGLKIVSSRTDFRYRVVRCVALS